jgi:enoyl-[acyl-carrier protein] reductase II
MISNRITQMLGVALPIVQAPMGWIARSQLASAVSNAGGMGIIETSSGELDAIRGEIARMRTLTDKPFGVNIAQAFVRDPGIVNFVADQGVKFVTTSAGDPGKYCAALKQAGLTVFHVVPTLKAALRAVEAGVDGLVVEGGEGGGFKHSDPVMTMVLLPQVAETLQVPIIAAGGISCGRTMAAAFAMGAEGVQLGTRMVSAAESPVHDNWKRAIVNADATDTVFLNHFGKPALRALRTERTSRLDRELGPDYAGPPVFAEFARVQELYFGGDMEASIALTGQVAGRIGSVLPVADILADMMAEFRQTVAALASRYGRQ